MAKKMIDWVTREEGLSTYRIVTLRLKDDRTLHYRVTTNTHTTKWKLLKRVPSYVSLDQYIEEMSLKMRVANKYC